MKAQQLLVIAARIRALEERLAVERARFYRLADSSDRSDAPAAPLLRKRETIAERVLAVFEGETQLPAGEVVHRLKNVRVEVVHTTLSKLASTGVLVRVAFGIYRRAA